MSHVEFSDVELGFMQVRLVLIPFEKRQNHITQNVQVNGPYMYLHNYKIYTD